MLSNAKNVIITGGTFTSQGHTDATTDGRRGIEILTSKIAPGAFHNAAERYDPPKCHPHTRTAVLKKIMEWIDDPVNLACFLWLYGPAGSGKSAIAQSIAEMCFKANKLAASFFFSRTVAGRNNETLFITTIVYQLILSIPEIHARVAKTLERDPLLLSRSLEAQLQALVIQPLSEAALDENDAISLKSRPRLVIVDGLDECGEPKSQFYILTTISTVVKQLAFPLIFLIASRPEQLIRQAFNNDLLNSLTTRLVLDDTYQPDADIKIFVESKIHDIKRNHPASAHFPPSWPSEIDIDRLVEKSSGQFIYISTVMKFLESHRHSPQDRLNIVFGISPLDNNMNTPFAELDALYHQIFSLVADLDKVFEVLIVLLFAYRVEKTPRSVEEFLSCSPGTLYILLSDLHSVISLPSPEDGGIIHFFHASLSDFLFDHARSGKLFIDSDIAQEFVVTCLLKRIKVDEEHPAKGENHLALPKHCLWTPHPSPELLRKLYQFDLEAYLNWCKSLTLHLPGNHDLPHFKKAIIPQFLLWLQQKSHPDYKVDLFQHNSRCIDDWIAHNISSFCINYSDGYRHRLDAILLSERHVSHEQTAAPHTRFAHAVTAMLADLDEHFRDASILSMMFVSAEYPDLHDLVSHFLGDPVRAGSYYFDGDKYASLVKQVLEFVTRWTPMLSNTSPSDISNLDNECIRQLGKHENDNDYHLVHLDLEPIALRHSRSYDASRALKLLSSLLPRASKTRELATFLKDHPVQLPNPDDLLYNAKHEAVEAIEVYLQDYEALNVIEETAPEISVQSKKREPGVLWPNLSTILAILVILLSYIAGLYTTRLTR